MSDLELSPEVQRALINQELAGLKQGAYILSTRHRINKKLGGTAEELKPIEDQLVKLQMQIDEWEKELKAMEG